jgi:hypothetical protein
VQALTITSYSVAAVSPVMVQESPVVEQLWVPPLMAAT